MSVKLTLSALVVALSAGAALAGVPQNGSDQLSLIAGVEPGTLSNTELNRLIEAKRDNDAREVAFILSKAGQRSGPVAGDAQTAALLGVEAGRFTAAELQILTEARRNNDAETVAWILSGDNRQGEAETASAGKAQLAAILGVDANQYSLAELTAIAAARND